MVALYVCTSSTSEPVVIVSTATNLSLEPDDAGLPKFDVQNTYETNSIVGDVCAKLYVLSPNTESESELV